MEENSKYKKCPFCELNYIPITEDCCDVCYRRAPIARKKNKLQSDKEYQLEQKIEENKYREILLKLLESLGFKGFLHTTNFKNFINIYNSGFLKSRNQLLAEGYKFEDNAERFVIGKTSESVKSRVRFYYRQLTPTNYSAYMWHNQKNPVMLVFDKKLIFYDDVLFYDGCAGSSLSKNTRNAKEAIKFNWKGIFSTGPFKVGDYVLKNHRNAEFLTSSPIFIGNAIKIYFRNYMDYVNACELFGSDYRFEYNPKMFIGD